MRVVETMHDKLTYWLVFDDNNDVVYKTSKREDADNFIHTAQRAKSNNK